MSEKVERALEIVRSFSEAEIHSFMEMLFVSENSQSNVSFNDLIGKNRFKNGIVCPHCNSHSAVRNGKRNGLQNYKCKDCGKFFSNTANTLALKSKYGLDTWKEYIECMMMGLSIRKSAAKCGISNATAFYWRHKILGALQNITEIKQKLSGIVEADETFKGIYHIQHINAFHSRLKLFMRPFQGVSTKHLNNYLVWYAWMQMNRELSEESLERNILNSSTSHNFRLLTSEISKKPVLPMAA